MKSPVPTMSMLKDFCRTSILYLTIIACVLLAFLMAFFHPSGSVSFWLHFSSFALFNLWTALTSVGLLCFTKRYFAQMNLRHFSILAVIFTTSVSILFSLLLAGYLQEPLFTWFLFRNAMVAFIVSGIFFRYYYLQQQSLIQVQAESEARVQALQSRIRPHFLFNSLNTLANMATQDPDKTEESILNLADIFRASMQRADKLIPFSEEQLLCEQYLQLEKQRLGDKLSYQWHTDIIDSQLPFPPLLLQPIIENAVYHGVQQRQDGGTINITGMSAKHHIELEVTNPLPTSTASLHKGNSLALKNISQRLEVLYQGRAKFSYHSTIDTFYCRLKIPKRLELTLD